MPKGSGPERWIESEAKVMERHMLYFDTGVRTCIESHVGVPFSVKGRVV